MVGQNCVAIASDTRFGVQALTVGTNLRKVFPMCGGKVYLGLSGLISDMLTLKAKLEFRCNMYRLREGRHMSPRVFANLVSTLLYEKRFGPYFCEPVIAGLNDDGTPFIAATDLIGAAVFAKDFVVSGTSGEELYGTCESLYRANLEPEDLFETISQSLMAAVDRDCLAGWGADVVIMYVFLVLYNSYIA